MNYAEFTKTAAQLRARARLMEFEKAAARHARGVPIEKLAEELGMSKEAIVPFLASAAARLAPALARAGGKLVGKGARVAAKPITAPGKAMGKGMLNYAKKKPVRAAMIGVTGLEGVGATRAGYKANQAAMGGIRGQAKMRQAMHRARKIDPTPQYAQISGF